MGPGSSHNGAKGFQKEMARGKNYKGSGDQADVKSQPLVKKVKTVERAKFLRMARIPSYGDQEAAITSPGLISLEEEKDTPEGKVLGKNEKEGGGG